MNALKRNRRRLKKPAIGAVVLFVFFCFTATAAFASTAENTLITNSVTVSYEDAANSPQTDITVSATVTVSIVAAAPTISSPGSIDPTTENTLNVLTYTITGNANGDDGYDLSAANAFDANLAGTATLQVNGGVAGNGDPVTGAITIGGTTLAADAAIGANTITVPYDNNADSDAASTNSITAGDTIIIGTNPYVVAPGGIVENAGANTTTITLVGNIAGTAGSIGDVVGERMTFIVNVTTSTLTGTNTSGNHTITTTATSQTSGTATVTQATPTVITVRRPLLTVTKYVANITSPVAGGGASIGPLDTGGGGGPQTYYTQGVTGVPTDTLEYLIVVENPAGGGQANDVVIQDQIPMYTTYTAGSMLLDPGTGVFGGLSDSETNTDAGEYDPTSGSETVWIYAGSGGADTGTAATYGDGAGGSLTSGGTTRGVFQVTINN